VIRRADRDGHEHGSSAYEFARTGSFANRGVDFSLRLSLAADGIRQRQAWIMAAEQGHFEKVKPVWNTWGKPFILGKTEMPQP